MDHTREIIFSATKFKGIVVEHQSSFLIRFPDEVAFTSFNANLKIYNAYTCLNNGMYKLYTTAGTCFAKLYIFTDDKSYNINFTDAIPINKEEKTFRLTETYIPHNWLQYTKMLSEKLIAAGYTYAPDRNIVQIISDLTKDIAKVYWHGDGVTKFVTVVFSLTGYPLPGYRRGLRLRVELEEIGKVFYHSNHKYFTFKYNNESVDIYTYDFISGFNPDSLQINHTDKTITLEEINLSSNIEEQIYIFDLICEYLSLEYTYNYDEKSPRIVKFNRRIAAHGIILPKNTISYCDIVKIFFDLTKDNAKVYWHGDEITKFVIIIFSKINCQEKLYYRLKNIGHITSTFFSWTFKYNNKSVKILPFTPIVNYNPDSLEINHTDKTITFEEINLSRSNGEQICNAALIDEYLSLGYTYNYDNKSERIIKFNERIQRKNVILPENTKEEPAIPTFKITCNTNVILNITTNDWSEITVKRAADNNITFNIK